MFQDLKTLPVLHRYLTTTGKKPYPKGSESFAFNWGLFRWRCGVLNVKTVGGRICGRNRLWYGGGEDSIISSPSSSLYQITGTINL
ncbi:L-arginine responsive protein LaoB [Escherichia coli]